MCATRLMPLAQNRGSCSAPGICARNSGLNSPQTVETFTPTFSNTRPRITLITPPPPSDPSGVGRCHAVRLNRPAGRSASGPSCASSIASNAAHSRSRSVSNQARAGCFSARCGGGATCSVADCGMGACSWQFRRVARAGRVLQGCGHDPNMRAVRGRVRSSGVEFRAGRAGPSAVWCVPRHAGVAIVSRGMMADPSAAAAAPRPSRRRHQTRFPETGHRRRRGHRHRGDRLDASSTT